MQYQALVDELTAAKGAIMRCLVLMSFAPAFEPVFQTVRSAVADAIPATPIDAYWMKDLHAPGRITDDILAGIQSSAFCVADLTGATPNVMWETGYSMAAGKPTILIGQSIESIPFDLKVYRIVPYTLQDLTTLATRLAEAVRQTLSKYELKSAPPPRVVDARHVRSIVVTGTREAPELKVRRRVDLVLAPYLGRGIHWYCGGQGVVDETAAQFLANAKERVIIVGHHKYDVSMTFRSLIDGNRAGFVDASVEHYPKTLQGAERNKYFVSRADLGIIFWDGVSKGSERIVEAFRANQVSVLTAFI